MIAQKETPTPNIPPVRTYRKDQRIRTKAGKAAFVLEDSNGLSVVKVRFLDKSIGIIPARFILEEAK